MSYYFLFYISSMNPKKILGNWGEQKACDFLLRRGYVVSQTNYFCKDGEIDIIAEHPDRKELLFVEVKTRSFNININNSAEFATDYYKLLKIKKTARHYCFTYNVDLDGVSILFKQISIYVYSKKARLTMYDLE